MVLTANNTTVRICVKDESYIGEARRAVRARAQEIGLSGQSLDKLDLLSTEFATNLCKYANSGREILVIDDSTADEKSVTLVSVDRGPGIADVENALVDGVSTSKTLGAGLGSIKRLSDTFEISSIVGKGTILLSRVHQSSSRAHGKKTGELLDVAFISTPHPGENVCGDGVAVCASEDRTSILVVDALGHGVAAADASELALRAFAQSPFEEGSRLVERLNTELTGSRGAAVALAQIEPPRNTLNFVGVGNISCRVYSYYESTGCVSSQGIVGNKMGTPLAYTYDWNPGSILLMHSDGIKSSAKVEPGKKGKSALMLAAEIYRDHYRSNDDATVLVSIDRRSK